MVEGKLELPELPLQYLPPFRCHFLSFFLKCMLDAASCPAGDYKIEPVFRGLLLSRSDDLHLIAIRQFLADGHQLVIDFGPYALVSDIRMDFISKIEGRGTGRQYFQITVGCKDIYLFAEKVEFKVIHKIQGIGFRILQQLPDFLQPIVQCAFAASFLVFPVGGKTFFRDLVHPFGTYLHLYPSALGAHDGGMQRFIAIGFRSRYPVAQAAGIRLIKIRHNGIDLPTLRLFFLRGGIYYNSNCKEVVHFFKLHVLLLHLLVDGVYGLGPPQYLVFHFFAVQLCHYRLDKLIDIAGAFAFCLLQFSCDGLIGFRLCVFQRKIFQFAFDGVKSETMSQRSIEIEGFAGNLQLLVAGHAVHGAHVVQAICNLDQYHAHILGQGKQQLPEVLGLKRALQIENLVDFREAVNDLGNLWPEVGFYVVQCDFGILHRIMKQCTSNGRRPETDLACHYFCYINGMCDIGFTRLSAHVFMRFCSHFKGFTYQFLVLSRKITVACKQ